MIEILKAGLLTVQDLGRYGYQKLGIPVSGVMDDYSARLANFLVGNDENKALLEFVLQGPTIKFHASSVFAIAGDIDVYLNDVKISPWKSYWAKRGDILEIGTLRSGVYGYVAFAGGADAPKILGSASTYVRANLGKPLKAGDRLKLGYTILTGKEGKELPAEFIPRYLDENKIRVVLGPQLEHFTEEGINTFLSSTYEVTPNSDRMGYRLEGSKIEHSELGADIITDAIPLGAVQIPANGKPIIMLADRQTTGGYAKIAVVTKIDIPRVAQTRVGGKLRFKAVDVEDAQKSLRKREILLQNLKRYLRGELRGYKLRALGEEFLVFVE